jgi:hypothetical protein
MSASNEGSHKASGSLVFTVHFDEDIVPDKVVCSICGRITAYLDEREDEIECIHCGATIDIPNKALTSADKETP